MRQVVCFYKKEIVSLCLAIDDHMSHLLTFNFGSGRIFSFSLVTSYCSLVVLVIYNQEWNWNLNHLMRSRMYSSRRYPTLRRSQQFHELKNGQRHLQCDAYRSSLNAAMMLVRTRYEEKEEERFATWARLVRMRTESCLAATEVKNNRRRKGIKLRVESVSASAPIWEGALARNQAVSSSDIWTLHSNIPSCKRRETTVKRRSKKKEDNVERRDRK